MTGPAVAEKENEKPRPSTEGADPTPMPATSLRPGFLTRADLVRTWSRAAAMGTLCLVVVFAGYEIVERTFFITRVSTQTLFLLHMARGISASILVGTISIGVVWWVRSRYEAAFRKAHHDLELAMERRVAEGKALEAHVRHQEKMAALGVLSAGIAHDIANPLASLSSELEMLELENDIERVRASLPELRKQVSRIDRALREMTDFARRRSDEVVSVPLHVAVDDAVRMVRHDPRARKVHVSVEVARDMTPVRAVEDHLVMVFVNLIINAFDAMPDGGDLRITSRADARGTTISVHDTGTGMSEEVRKRALEPLFTTKKGGKGTGLGLSVTAGVVEAAGGSITLLSEPDGGTEVQLFFPRSAPKSAPESRAEAPHG